MMRPARQAAIAPEFETSQWASQPYVRDGVEQPRAADSGHVVPLAVGLTAPPGITAERVRHIRALREKRRLLFAQSLFADPAWDILLALYAAHLDQHRVSITSLTNHAGVPGTTVLRWICKLEAAGLIQRTNDQTDNRRVFIALSQNGAEAMNIYFTLSGAEIAFC